jgi:hypothetical protein
MGIEPTRKALSSLSNKWFGAMANAKCVSTCYFQARVRSSSSAATINWLSSLREPTLSPS